MIALFNDLAYLTLPMSDLSVGAKIKKHRIWELLEAGNYSPDEISKLVGTTVENVYKETSLLRKSGRKVVLVRSRKNSIVTSPSGRREVSRTEKVRLEVESNEHISMSSLGNDEIRALYGDFQSGQKPAEIVAKRGLHPEAVEIEYRRHQRMLEQDRGSLVEQIVNNIITAHSDSVDMIKERYRRGGLLGNSEVTLLLSLNNVAQFENGQNALLSRISDLSKALPDGCVRPSCNICKSPIADILITQNSHAEKETRRVMLFCPKHQRY